MLHCSAHCDFLRGDCHSFSTAETRDWRAVCARKCFDKFGAQNRLHKANILLLVKVKWDDNFGMRYVYIVRAVESNLSCSWSHPANHDPDSHMSTSSSISPAFNALKRSTRASEIICPNLPVLKGALLKRKSFMACLSSNFSSAHSGWLRA